MCRPRRPHSLLSSSILTALARKNTDMKQAVNQNESDERKRKYEIYFSKWYEVD